MAKERGFIAAVRRFFRRVRKLILWLWYQFNRIVGGILGPPWRRFVEGVRALLALIERAIEWVLDKWAAAFKSGDTGKKPREERIGVTGVGLLTAVSLALLWYVVPVARLTGIDQARFVLWGFALWLILFGWWFSRCRIDRDGRIARFARRIHRSTGLRRLDQIGLALSLLLGVLVFWQHQLLPLAFACVVGFVTALSEPHRERPSIPLVEPPTFPLPSVPADGTPVKPRGGTTEPVAESDGPDSGPDSVSEDTSRNLELTWTVTAHGRSHRQHATVQVSDQAIEAAREWNRGSDDDPDRIVDWLFADDAGAVESLARQIHEQAFTDGFSVVATVSSYVAAVQSLPYMADLETTGQEEYWRTPVETLADGHGDCEDLALLLAALLRRSGFRCLLLLAPGHAAVGVEVPNDVAGAYLEHEGVRYYYCETTDSGWTVGMVPDDVAQETLHFVTVPEWDR